ncbi:MAG: hypothetical protein EHM18_03290 [Acidobacteria bacterium]|nr:MAG: hypothetical protein EHM18_03290 [Acidobacteriota bacterium]
MEPLRFGYRAQMRTSSLVDPIDIVWVQVPDDTPLYTGRTVFRSRNWAKEPFNDGMGEQSEGRICCGKRDIQWYSGANANRFSGGMVPCGTDDVARVGGGPEDPLFATMEDGSSPCCSGDPAFVTRLALPFGADATFHGNGAPPSLGQFIFWSIQPPFIIGTTASTGDDFTITNGSLPGGQVFFQFTNLITHWSLSLVFLVAMDFWQIDVWGLRYLEVRFKRSGGSVQRMTLSWPNP